jgi:O-antigen/teichoic acid export membrane protein
MYTYFGVFALMIAGFFVVFGQEIAVFLFGEDFRFSGYMLQYAAPALVFNCWATISLNMLAGLGKIKQRLGVVALALGVNVGLNRLFLVFLGKGLIFSAMILSASWVVMALGAMGVIGRSYPFTLDWKFLLKNVGLIGLLGMVMWWMKGMGVGASLLMERWDSFWGLLAFFGGYGAVLVAMNWGRMKALMEEIRKLRG